jgi:hypothetical protein
MWIIKEDDGGGEVKKFELCDKDIKRPSKSRETVPLKTINASE